MRKAMLLLAVFGLAGSLYAADPSVGTWKLNIAKSKYAPSTEAAVKEITVVIREIGDQWEISYTGKRVDGSSISFKGTRPQQGGIGKNQPPAEKGEVYVDTVVESGNWFLTVLQNGKQVSVTQCLISKDGKTMRQITKGTDAKGKSYQDVEVFDRQ